MEIPQPVSNTHYIVRKLLTDAGTAGMSQEEMMNATGWKSWTVNTALCELPMGSYKVRKIQKRGTKKETRYYLKEFFV